MSITGSRAHENWGLRVEGPNGFERSYTLAGSAGEHKPDAVRGRILNPYIILTVIIQCCYPISCRKTLAKGVQTLISWSFAKNSRKQDAASEETTNRCYAPAAPLAPVKPRNKQSGTKD